MIIVLAMSALVAQSALARNLGALSDDQKPQKLSPASEFVNMDSVNSDSALNDSNEAVTSESQGLTSDVRRGHGGYGHHYGHGYYRHYPYYNYYPYYGYGYGYNYPYYGYGYNYPYRRYANESGVSSSDVTTNNIQNTADGSRTPVVCFASDASGNWYADADTSTNALTVQQNVNNECLQSGANCAQNLGCAIISSEN